MFPVSPGSRGLCAAASLCPQSTTRDLEPILIGRRCACLGSSTRLGCGWLLGDGQGCEAQRAVPHPPAAGPGSTRLQVPAGAQSLGGDLWPLAGCEVGRPTPASRCGNPACVSGSPSATRKGLAGSRLPGSQKPTHRSCWEASSRGARPWDAVQAGGFSTEPRGREGAQTGLLSQDKAAEPLSCLRSSSPIPTGDRQGGPGRPPPGTVMGGGVVMGSGWWYRSPHTSLGRSGLLLCVHREDWQPRGKQVPRTEALGVSPLAS